MVQPCYKNGEDCKLKQVLECWPGGKRGRGRPCIEWEEYVEGIGRRMGRRYRRYADLSWTEQRTRNGCRNPTPNGKKGNEKKMKTKCFLKN